jgi:hypothetical protein
MKKLLELNLIGDRITHLKNVRTVMTGIRIGYVVCFVAFSALVMDLVFVSMRISDCKKKITSLQMNIQAERAGFGMDGLETEWRKYAVQLRQIDGYVSKRTSYGPLLIGLSKSLPVNAFVSRINADSRAGNKVTVEIIVPPGGRPGLDTINEFMDKFKREGVAGSTVNLDSQDKTQFNDRPAETFKISMVW